jgi:multisubunit Na+/H+ antiporter MnhG subunit
MNSMFWGIILTVAIAWFVLSTVAALLVGRAVHIAELKRAEEQLMQMIADEKTLTLR